MARTGRRREWGAVRPLPPIPGALEKGAGNDPPRPYREPTLVPLGEKPTGVWGLTRARELGKLAP